MHYIVMTLYFWYAMLCRDSTYQLINQREDGIILHLCNATFIQCIHIYIYIEIYIYTYIHTVYIYIYIDIHIYILIMNMIQ